MAQILETERLILREYTEDDFDDLIEEIEDVVNTITKVYGITREEWRQTR
ncbi:MAG: hypothetical protein KA953_07555 [Lachnospiraceae bacterium]|nr:hypothetical protein [Lachnospiraceae bacterium]